MSAPGHANPSAHGDPSANPRRLSITSRSLTTTAIVASSRIRGYRVSGPACGAIAASAAFLALTCWWFTQDRSIPIFDVGFQLSMVREYHNMIVAGNLLGPLDHVGVYPIFGGIVGAIAMVVGGVNVASPTIGENVVFVPLLALGCYQTGRLLFGPVAGMLAVVFVLGSPLLISLFHVFLLDAPLTAMVAVAVWLVLASEDFKRVGVSCAAGLAIGLGMNVKVQFGLFLAGLVLIAIAHGGWRNRRGLAAFSAVAIVVATPWYIIHITELPRMFELASSGPGTPAGNVPPTLSIDNFSWYFWNVLNSQLLAPLFAFVLAGATWMLWGTIRGRGRQTARLEFLGGGFAAWLAITLTPHHDIRYGLPLLAFLAVIGTGWITALPRTASLAASCALVLAVTATTLGLDFGVGQEATLALVSRPPSTEQYPDRIVFYATSGFLASAPQRDGDVPGLLQELHREGVQTVVWSVTQTESPDFSWEGLKPLALMSGMTPVMTERLEYGSLSSVATLVHMPVGTRARPTCTRLSDGTGVWVVRYDPHARALALYCPTHQPRFYAVGFAR